MLHVTLQHDFTSTLDSGVQTDMIVLEFSKLLTEFQTFSLLGRLHHDGIRGYPTVDHILPFLAEPSVAVEGCSSDSVPVLRGGVLYVSVLGPLLFLQFILYVPDTPNTSRRVFTITWSAH